MNDKRSELCICVLCVMLMMFSQVINKKGNESPIPSVISEKATSYTYGDIVLAVFGLACIGFSAFLILYVVPEGAEKNVHL
jgi:hypothetical protein